MHIETAKKLLREYLELISGKHNLARAINTALEGLDKKDKIILKMAEYIEKGEVGETFCENCKCNEEECTHDDCIKSIIKYFEE